MNSILILSKAVVLHGVEYTSNTMYDFGFSICNEDGSDFEVEQ